MASFVQPEYAPSPSVAQPAPATPMTYYELKMAIRARDTNFGCKRYIKQAHKFTANNWCKLLGAMLVWWLIGWGVNVGINALSSRSGHHSTWDEPGQEWTDDVQYSSACLQQQLSDEANCGGMGCYKTKCQEDGSYAPQQTLGSACWCVDEQGMKFEDTVESCALFTPNCALRRTQSACEAKRARETKSCGNRIGCFVTQCDDNGNFLPSQKHSSANSCWCVNEKGMEVNGTRNSCSQLGATECEEFPYTWPDMSASMPSMDDKSIKQLVLWGFLNVLASIFIWNPAIAGAYVAVFNAIKTNTPIVFRDFFACFNCRYYCKLARLSIVLRFLEAILLLLVIPGLWWVLATMFAIPLHKEHSFLGVCGSIRLSLQVIHRHFCSIIGFLILLGLLQIAGFLCFIVGLLYTMPLAFVALCYCYHDLVGIVSEVPLAGPVDVPMTVHV